MICLFGLKPYKTMKNQIKIKTSKSAFEQLIVGIYGNMTLSKRKVVEEEPPSPFITMRPIPTSASWTTSGLSSPTTLATWQRSGAWYHDKEDKK